MYLFMTLNSFVALITWWHECKLRHLISSLSFPTFVNIHKLVQMTQSKHKVTSPYEWYLGKLCQCGSLYCSSVYPHNSPVR